MMRNETPVAAYVRTHIIMGCIMLGAFAFMGLVLEAFHGFKLPFFLDVHNETRRLLLRLSHSHGVLLGLCQLAFAFVGDRLSLSRGLSSWALHGASLLLPLGFFIGGWFLAANGNDPGLGVLLVPPGGMLLVVAFFGLSLRSFKDGRTRHASEE
ncbi:MAG: hypothetical protein GY822_21065 [Deltaproteobacteria bacterium]|nr:hypothetical protein [Deltaproteobacteria bacterium]